MNIASHQFKVGTLECVALSDGTFAYPASWFFSNVPEERLKEVLRAAIWQPSSLSERALSERRQPRYAPSLRGGFL